MKSWELTAGREYHAGGAKITVEKIDRHRNGICGAPFYAVLFRCADGPMLGVVFDVEKGFKFDGRVAVLHRERLAQGVIGMHEGVGNAWRGDYFEAALRAAITDWNTAVDAAWKKMGDDD